MSKRLSDTEVWKKPWFFDLPDKYKLFWFYILSDCDAAGIWTANFKIAKLYLGEVSPEKTAEILKNQIQILNGGSYWFIIYYIKFQYGYPIKETSPMYKKLSELLSQRGLLLDTLYDTVYDTVSIEYLKISNTVKDKDKDKDTAKESSRYVSKEIEGGFEKWYLKYPRKEKRADALKAWKKNHKEMPEFQVMMETLAKQIRIKNWTPENMQYIPMPSSYLNGKRWQDNIDDKPTSEVYHSPDFYIPQG